MSSASTTGYVSSGVNFAPSLALRGDRAAARFQKPGLQGLYYKQKNVRDLKRWTNVSRSYRQDPFSHVGELNWTESRNPLRTSPATVTGMHYDLPPRNGPQSQVQYVAPVNYANQLYALVARGKPEEDLSYLYKEAAAAEVPNTGVLIEDLQRAKQVFDANTRNVPSNPNEPHLAGFRPDLPAFVQHPWNDPAQADAHIEDEVRRIGGGGITAKARQLHSLGYAAHSDINHPMQLAQTHRTIAGGATHVYRPHKRKGDPIEFGKYVMDKSKLGKGILSLSYPNGHKVPGHTNHKVTDALADLLLNHRSIPDSTRGHVLRSLPKHEQLLANQVLKGSGVDNGIPQKTIDMQLLEKYTGEIRVGNIPNQKLGLTLSKLVTSMEKRGELNAEQAKAIDVEYVRKALIS